MHSFLFAVIVGQWQNSFHTEGSSYSLKPENSSFDVLFGPLIVNQLCFEREKYGSFNGVGGQPET